MGSSLAREQQFLRCGTTLPLPCFVRRFVVPLHRARADFALDDLREGRIDLAARYLANPSAKPLASPALASPQPSLALTWRPGRP